VHGFHRCFHCPGPVAVVPAVALVVVALYCQLNNH
jgi:hypothetical protein